MIKINFIGRLGNNMIQYSLGRYIAENKGYELNYSEIGNTSTKEMFSLFKETNRHISGKNVTENILTLGYNNLDNNIHKYDIELLLNHIGGIELKGFFQKYDLFFNHKDIIKSYFLYDTTNLKTSKDYDVVIHIRLGDYVSLNHFIHPDKIYNLYKNLDFLNALIISDDPNSYLLSKFLQDNTCVVQKNSILQDLHYMATSKNIIISQSTFSWWGSYLGNEKDIYVPYGDSEYPWSYQPNNDDIDLIPNKSNYKKIKV